MATKVKFNAKRFEKNLKKRFEGFTKDGKEMEKVAKTIVRNIKADAREGKDFDGKSFPSLASSTIDRRRRLAETNNVSRFFSAARSNATFLGDTINKIKGAFKGKGMVELFGEGKHRKIKGVRGKPLKGSDAKISDILAGLKARGWNILGVSEKSRNSIRKQFIRYLRRRRRR